MDEQSLDELTRFKQRVEQLEAQRKQDESNFGQRRAQFMEMYTKKEG